MEGVTLAMQLLNVPDSLPVRPVTHSGAPETVHLPVKLGLQLHSNPAIKVGTYDTQGIVGRDLPLRSIVVSN